MFDLVEWSREIFAKNLRYYLSLSGNTQKELAQIIGVSAPTMHEWCRGKKTPRMDKVEKLANYFGILKSDLIEDKQKQSSQGELASIENALSKEEFALFGEVRDLTAEEKKKVLDFIKFTKSQRNE